MNIYRWVKFNKEITETHSYYSATTTYFYKNEVIYDGKLYFCTQDNTINIAPIDYED